MIMTFKKLSDEMNRLLDWLQTNKTDKESLYCWYYLLMMYLITHFISIEVEFVVERNQ